MHAFSKRPSARHPISSCHLRAILSLSIVRVRREKFFFIFSRVAYKFLNFCRTLSTVNISEMMEVLTRQNLRSRRFLRDEMFRCVRSGAEDPTDEYWMFAIYRSIAVKNGIELGIRDADSVFQVIKPFTKGLFRTTFYHRESINSDYKLVFQTEILTTDVIVAVGDYYYRSDRNPFQPEMMGMRRNLNLFSYLDQPFFIGIRTELLRLPPTHNPDNVESSSPKPLGKTFKSDQCVICLEEEPKVLFCNCGHICICEKCASHRYDNCPVCKKENTILRIIE